MNFHLALVTLTLCLAPTWCQVFSFPNSPIFKSSCGLEANLSVDGMVTLSPEDLDDDHFQSTVYIQTTSEICTIDLNSCALEGPPTDDDTCGCVREGETLFLLYIRKRINPSESGKMLQAALHHHDSNNPTIVLANIGVLMPVVGNSSHSGHAVFTLADGSSILCDTATDGGNWVVIQHRSSAAVDFYRNWKNYTDGFGDIHTNFWLGLNKIYQMCNNTCELRIDMTFNNRNYHATYRQFSISDAASFFKLHVGGYEGDAGDELTGRGNGMAFTTKDQEHDTCHTNCANIYFGGWWYDCCHGANLNGHWGDTAYARGLTWLPLTTYYKSLSYVQMKVRPYKIANIGHVVVG